MVKNHYRWDFIGLSTDDKPTPETSEKVTDGSTFYCSDTSKLYVFCEGEWYEKVAQGGGGGGTSDFNQLSNRPKYNGTAMTGTTDIPEVPTVNDATLTITQNGTSKGTFTANDADDTTIALTDTTYSAGSGLDLTGTEFSVDTTTIQPKLTAGSNVTIDANNEISATDTTYSNFTGTDGSAAGTAGLVPAPATTDAGKFLKADGTWDTAGGGSGPTVVQTTGTSTTDVMSQNSTTGMIFADPARKRRIRIGEGTSASDYSIGIGDYASTGSGEGATAIGRSATAFIADGIAIGTGAVARDGLGSIALGAYSGGIGTFTAKGMMHIGTSQTLYGYNNSNYRLLTGLYDPQSAHDAATKGYVDEVATMGTLTATPTGTTVGVPGRLYTHDSGGGTYEVYLCVHDNGDNTYVWKQVNLI